MADDCRGCESEPALDPDNMEYYGVECLAEREADARYWGSGRYPPSEDSTIYIQGMRDAGRGALLR